jgi:hypothetical protein
MAARSAFAERYATDLEFRERKKAEARQWKLDHPAQTRAARQARWATHRERLLALAKQKRDALSATEHERRLAQLAAYYVAHQEGARAYAKARYVADPATHCARVKASYRKHSVKARARAKTYILAHSSRVTERDRAYRLAHHAQVRAKNARWIQANRGRFNALCAKRRASRLRATPAWADLTAIRAIYLEAVRLTQETGIPHAVDHYYPLISPLVCGLHVEHNLRVITRSENSRKKNHHPDQRSA